MRARFAPASSRENTAREIRKTAKFYPERRELLVYLANFVAEP
jgi:hypothetical protein